MQRKRVRCGVLLCLTLALVLVMAACKTTEELRQGPTANFAGNWETKYGVMVITQVGSKVNGYYPKGGMFEGVVTGRIMDVAWHDEGGEGSLVLTLASDGKSFSGEYTMKGRAGWKKGWNGVRIE